MHTYEKHNMKTTPQGKMKLKVGPVHITAIEKGFSGENASPHAQRHMAHQYTHATTTQQLCSAYSQSFVFMHLSIHPLISSHHETRVRSPVRSKSNNLTGHKGRYFLSGLQCLSSDAMRQWSFLLLRGKKWTPILSATHSRAHVTLLAYGAVSIERFEAF